MRRKRLIGLIAVVVGVLPILNGIFLYLHSMWVLNGGRWMQILRVTFVSGRQNVMRETLWTKPLMDLALLTVLAGFFLYVRDSRELSIPKWPTFLVFLGAVGFAFSTTVISQPVLALAGLRGLSALLLFFVGYNCFKPRSFVPIANVVIGLAILAGVMGIAQQHATDLVVPGSFSIFFYPNSFAVFQLTALGFLIVRSIPLSRKLPIGGLFVWSIFASGSTVGLLGLVGIVILWGVLAMDTGLFAVFVALVAGVFSAGVMVVVQFAVSSPLKVGTLHYELLTTVLSSRHRFEIFLGILRRLDGIELLVGRGLGYGSSTAYNIVRLLGSNAISGESIFIADSLYSALLAQTGILGLLAFVVFNVRAFWIANAGERSFLDDAVIVIVPLMFLFSAGQNVLEFFPVNWIYWLLLGNFLGAK